MNRRMFLGQAAVGVPVVFGLAALRGQGEKAEDPDWWPDALAWMKATGRWGLVIVTPPPADQFQWGQSLWAMTAFPDEDVDAHEVFSEAVVMVAGSEFVRKKFALEGRVDRVLLTPEGRRLAWDQFDRTVIRETGRFAESFRTFIHGPKNERLKERASAIEAGLSDEVKRAVKALESESVDDRTSAAALLAGNVEGLTPYLAWLEHESGGPRQRRAARELLSGYFTSLKEKEAGSKLPYGCSGPHPHDSCPSCGLGRRPPRSTKFLRFLVPGAPDPRRDIERDE